MADSNQAYQSGPYAYLAPTVDPLGAGPSPFPPTALLPKPKPQPRGGIPGTADQMEVRPPTSTPNSLPDIYPPRDFRQA